MKDLINDPNEFEQLKELRKELIDNLEDQKEGFIKDNKLIVGREQSSLINYEVK